MLGFILAVAAGYLTPMIEDSAARPLAKSLSGSVKIESGEIRTLAFILAMLAAGLLASAFDSGSAFGLILGGALGYFGTRIVAALRKTIDPPRS